MLPMLEFLQALKKMSATRLTPLAPVFFQNECWDMSGTWLTPECIEFMVNTCSLHAIDFSERKPFCLLKKHASSMQETVHHFIFSSLIIIFFKLKIVLTQPDSLIVVNQRAEPLSRIWLSRQYNLREDNPSRALDVRTSSLTWFQKQTTIHCR